MKKEQILNEGIMMNTVTAVEKINKLQDTGNHIISANISLGAPISFFLPIQTDTFIISTQVKSNRNYSSIDFRTAFAPENDTNALKLALSSRSNIEMIRNKKQPYDTTCLSGYCRVSSKCAVREHKFSLDGTVFTSYQFEVVNDFFENLSFNILTYENTTGIKPLLSTYLPQQESLSLSEAKFIISVINQRLVNTKTVGYTNDCFSATSISFTQEMRNFILSSGNINTITVTAGTVGVRLVFDTFKDAIKASLLPDVSNTFMLTFDNPSKDKKYTETLSFILEDETF